MASVNPGHVALDNVEYVIAEDSYIKQTQTPFNSRFSTGDPREGDLSFFQFVSMDDFSGGNGQEIFNVTNRFLDSEGVDVTTPGELKLAPKIELLAAVNGPQHEHLNEPVEDEDGWPQVIEWLGQAVIYNDRIEYDSGGVDFLEVFETDVIKDQVINKDPSGTAGVITNDTNAVIEDITKVSGLPGDLFQVRVKFSNIKILLPSPSFFIEGNAPKSNATTLKLRFRLYFGGDEPSHNEEKRHDYYVEETKDFANALFSQAAFGSFFNFLTLTTPITISFNVKVPVKTAGIYNLWTAAGIADQAKGDPSQPRFAQPSSFTNFDDSRMNDPDSHAKVLFFIESISDVIVNRKNLYAPQLKAACVSGDKLIGGRVFDNKAYIEVYQRQNDAVDRTMQIDLTAVSSIPNPPTYMMLIASNDVIVAAFDNKIYKIDIETSGLTDAQRITSLGTVPGDYVSGLEVWNQRVYIASFDKSRFTSAISWTNLTVIERSYAIDGKFWITDLATFNGALFYSGGTQDGIGQVRAFPAETILELSHPEFDNRVRCLNAGRKLYAGWSHGTGIAVIDERGASTWARINLGENSTNVVWDIEEVGDTVFVLADSGLFRTTPLFQPTGYVETSQIGGNTPLIDKDWSSVRIELKEIISGPQTIKIWAENANAPGALVAMGEINNTSQIDTEFLFPRGFSSPWVKLIIELSTSDERITPIIKKVTIKYVPQSLAKLQWAFGIRAYDNITFLNGQHCKQTGSEIMSELFELRKNGVITFRDIDDEVYSVTITDMKQRNPIVNKQKLEGLVVVELLEL